MVAYASVNDVQSRLPNHTLTTSERQYVATLLQDAAVMIDQKYASAADNAKLIVSCRMVLRVLAAADDTGVPMGATQGSMSALGYSQSWTIGNGGSAGEMYIGKEDRMTLGAGNAIGSRSPVEDLVAEVVES